MRRLDAPRRLAARALPLALALALALGAAGCGVEEAVEALEDLVIQVDGRPVEHALETSVAAAHAATLTMAALDGADVDCAIAGGPCADGSCGFRFELDTSGCPIPIGDDEGGGSVYVSGSVVAPGTVVMFASYADAHVGNSSWAVLEIAAITIVRDGANNLTSTYVQESVRVTAGWEDTSAALAQHVYVTVIDVNGTPADTRDDSHVVSGARQSIETGDEGLDVSQLVLAGVRIPPDCRRNPVEGTAVMERLAVGAHNEVTVATLGFHPACDGKADLISAVGVGLPNFFGTVDVDLTH